MLDCLRRRFLGLSIRTARLHKCHSEEEAEVRLARWLRFLRFGVRRQVVRKTKSGVQRADLLVCGMPIELKYAPSGPEMDRLVGQLLRYKKEWKRVIAVIVGGKKGDLSRVKQYAKGVRVMQVGGK